MTALSKSALRRIAQILEEEAECIRGSHTLHGQWCLLDAVDRSAKAQHDEMKSLAQKARAAATAKPKRGEEGPSLE